MATVILVIDDSDKTRDLVADTVDTARAEVRLCGDPKEGWQLAKRETPALVVINADLPKGWGLATKFRKTPRFEATPVVVLSAHEEMFERHQKVRKLAADAYLKRPLETEQELERFRLAIDFNLVYRDASDAPAADEVEFELEFDLEGFEADDPTPAPSALETEALPAEPGTREAELELQVGALERTLREQRASLQEKVREAVRKQAQAGYRRLAALQQDLEDARKEEAAAKALLEQAQGQLDALGQEADDARAALDRALVDQASGGSELEAALARIEQLETAGLGLEAARSEQALEVEALKLKLEAIEAERDAMAERARMLDDVTAEGQALGQRAQDAEAALDELRAALSERDGQVESLRSALAAATGRADEAEAGREEVGAKLLEEIQEGADLRESLEASQAELTETRASRDGAQAEVAQLTVEREALAAAKGGLETQLSTRTEELTEARLAWATLERALARTRAELAIRTAERDVAAAHGQALAGHADQISAQYAAAREGASATDAGLRQAIERLQTREGALMHREEALKARAASLGGVLHKLSESLLDLASEATGAAEDRGADDAELPPGPDAMPAEVGFEDLPSRPEAPEAELEDAWLELVTAEDDDTDEPGPAPEAPEPFTAPPADIAQGADGSAQAAAEGAPAPEGDAGSGDGPGDGQSATDEAAGDGEADSEADSSGEETRSADDAPEGDEGQGGGVHGDDGETDEASGQDAGSAGASDQAAGEADAEAPLDEEELERADSDSDPGDGSALLAETGAGDEEDHAPLFELDEVITGGEMLALGEELMADLDAESLELIPEAPDEDADAPPSLEPLPELELDDGEATDVVGLSSNELEAMPEGPAGGGAGAGPPALPEDANVETLDDEDLDMLELSADEASDAELGVEDLVELDMPLVTEGRDGDDAPGADDGGWESVEEVIDADDLEAVDGGGDPPPLAD